MPKDISKISSIVTDNSATKKRRSNSGDADKRLVEMMDQDTELLGYHKTDYYEEQEIVTYSQKIVNGVVVEENTDVQKGPTKYLGSKKDYEIKVKESGSRASTYSMPSVKEVKSKEVKVKK